MASWKQEAELIDAPQSIGSTANWRDDAVLVDPVERAKAGPLSAPSPLASVASGVVHGVGGMVATATTPFFPDVAAKISAGMADLSEARRQRIKESGKGTVSKWVHTNLPGAVRSITQATALAPLGGPSFLGRSMALGGGFGAISGTESYHEGLRAGMEKDEAVRYGAVAGTLEAGIMLAFQGLSRFIPGLGGMEEAFTGQMAKHTSRELLKGVPVRVAAELTEEEITEILQAYNTAAQLPGAEDAANWQGDDSTFWTSPMWKTMQDTASQTVLTMGLVETVAGSSRLAKLKAIRAVEPRHLKREAAEAGITGTRSEVRKKLDAEIQQAEQEIQDAQAVPRVEEEVREDEGREDIRRRRPDEVGAEPTREGVEAQEVPIEPMAPDADWGDVWAEAEKLGLAPKLEASKEELIAQINAKRAETQEVPVAEEAPAAQPAAEEAPPAAPQPKPKEAPKAAPAEDQELKELRRAAGGEVGQWKRRTKRRGGRLANPTLAGLMAEVNKSLRLIGLTARDDVSPEAIETAYRRASIEAHPDRGGSKEQQSAVNRANELLKSAPATLDLAKRMWEQRRQPQPVPQPPPEVTPEPTAPQALPEVAPEPAAPQPPPDVTPVEEAPTPPAVPVAPREAAEEPGVAHLAPDTDWNTVKTEAKALGIKVKGSREKLIGEINVKRAEAAPAAPSPITEPAATEETEPAAEFGKDPASGVGIAATVPITPPRGGVGRSITNFFQRFFTTRGELPQDVYDSKIRKEGRVAKEMQKLRFAATDFQRGIRKALGGKELTQANLEQMNAVLRGEADMSTVPEEARAPLQAMRDHIDSLSRDLIAEGVAQGDLVGIIAENMGVYATRSYRVFDDPKWRDRVPEDVRNRAWHAVSEMYPEKSEQERQGILESLLFRGAAETPAQLLKGSKLGSKDLSTFMKRQDVPKWLRDLWGEYKDAGVNYARSVFKMSHLLANHQFLNEVREAGLGKWLRSAEDGPIVNEFGEVITPIAAEGSSVMEPLNGLYTTPEIKAAFERMDSPGAMPSWLRAIMSVNYAVKYAKTVGSMMTHIRNFISNAGFAVANGHWRLDQTGRAIWATATGTFQLPNAEFRKYYQRLAELGLVGEDVRAGELKDALREASKVDIDEFLYNREARHAKKAVKLGRSGVRFLNSLYQAEDGVWKIYAWENEKARYAEAHPEWTEQQVEEHAAKIVRDTYPTYSKIPEGVKAIRRFPLVGTFVSFPAEVVRTTFNTLNLGTQEMQSPGTRAIGAQRLAGTAISLGGFSVLSRAMMAMFGIGDEEDEDLRWFVPPWQENSRFIYTGEPEDATVEFVDMGYSDPHAYLTDSAVAFMRGEDWRESLRNATAEFLRPFASEEILAKALMDLRSNEDNKIYNPQDNVGEQAKDMVEHMWTKALEPGTISSLRRINTAIAGTDPRKDVKTEVMALLTGQRFQKVDVEHSLGFRVRDFKKALANIQGIARRTAMSRGTATGEMVATDVARMERLRLAEFAEMQKIVGAARRLGVPEKNIRNMLEAQLADDVAEQIMTGDYSPYEMTSQTLQRMMDAQPAEFAERFAAWHGEGASEAAKRFARSQVKSLGAPLPDQDDDDYEKESRKHEQKVNDTRAMLNAFGMSHDQVQELLAESFWRYTDGKMGSELTLGGDWKADYDRAGKALANLYGEDFRAWRNTFKGTRRIQKRAEWKKEHLTILR